MYGPFFIIPPRGQPQAIFGQFVSHLLRLDAVIMERQSTHNYTQQHFNKAFVILQVSVCCDSPSQGGDLGLIWGAFAENKKIQQKYQQKLGCTGLLLVLVVLSHIRFYCHS